MLRGSRTWPQKNNGQFSEDHIVDFISNYFAQREHDDERRQRRDEQKAQTSQWFEETCKQFEETHGASSIFKYADERRYRINEKDVVLKVTPTHIFAQTSQLVDSPEKLQNLLISLLTEKD